jgi:RNA polymerase sigma factor
MMEVTKLRELDYIAVEAAHDKQKMNKFIQQNESFIMKCTSAVTHNFITKSDDEWSVALLAFSQAVQDYELSKGSFYKFAELVIRRRLIDYVRSQHKYNSEISVDPVVFDTEPDEDDEDSSIKLAVAEQVSQNGTSDDVTLEIESINSILQEYGFSFFDLTDCSPKAQKTKKSCAIAVSFLYHNPLIIQEMYRTKQLPIKIIETNMKIPRKILERHRKYIIAVTLILSGEYPHLEEYLWYIREEINK